MNENTYFCQISLDINRIIFQLKKMERKIEKYIYVSEQIEVQLLNKYTKLKSKKCINEKNMHSTKDKNDNQQPTSNCV